LTSSHPFHFKDQFVWTYHNPVAVHAAPGSLDRLPGLLAGRDCLLVTFPEAESLGLVQRLRQLLGSQLRGVVDGIAPNPDVRWLAPLYDRVHREHADVPCIVALGGGSAIDSAKALMCATPSQTFAELLQALEQGLTLPAARHKALIAIPTTAGTGSEVTPWATIWDQAAGRKHSLHQRWTWPEAAIIDAQLMQSLPAAATLASGLDALSHAMEAIWNRHRNPVSTSLAVQAARRTLATLPALMKDLGSLPLRNRMAEAALMAGLAFSNTRTALAPWRGARHRLLVQPAAGAGDGPGRRRWGRCGPAVHLRCRHGRSGRAAPAQLPRRPGRGHRSRPLWPGGAGMAAIAAFGRIGPARPQFHPHAGMKKRGLSSSV
jgi:phosphonate metabolism-associated iron-containing alcohol dehydrogenase